MNFELKINDDKFYINNFDDAVKIINDTLNMHFKISQCYYNNVPFSVGCLESLLYDNNQITDKQIVVFEKLNNIVKYIGSKNKEDLEVNLIDKNYFLHYKDEYVYDFKIKRVKGSIVVMLKVDCKEFVDYFETNMFFMEDGKKYYFNSKQHIVIKMPNDPLNLGDIIQLNISLE